MLLVGSAPPTDPETPVAGKSARASGDLRSTIGRSAERPLREANPKAGQAIAAVISGAALIVW